ncbi:hypothetical protein J1N35_015775 [Gossypium stocksii]|uniref:Uncharacterized protein n=1 Tax=Gossypium stocksii TaxID=47602 RepID=A0A9D4AAN8_9ROSI|nr:hypothetical protein J1N35_015775 [Gossypium stocksii]
MSMKRASLGSVIRGTMGNCIFRFNRSVGTCSVTQAKLWTIFDEQSIVSEKSFQHVTLERNNTSSTVHMINRNIEGANNIGLRRSVKELRG